jgi:hypothetical protein
MRAGLVRSAAIAAYAEVVGPTRDMITSIDEFGAACLTPLGAGDARSGGVDHRPDGVIMIRPSASSHCRQ